MTGRGVRRTTDATEGEAIASAERAPAREEVTAATDATVRPVAVSHDVAARPSGRWALDSRIKEVLLEDYGGLSDVSLHDFLIKYFKKTFGVEDTSMRVFMDDPSLCVSDEAVLRRITNSSPYMEFVEYKTMKEGVDRLHALGIVSLCQWAHASDKAGIFNAYVKGKLSAALDSARRNAEDMSIANLFGGEKLDDIYDSVFNAEWSYVLRSDEYDEKWLGMGVLDVAPGKQPCLWSEAQADVPYDPEELWEGDEVPGVSGKLVMAALKSHKGWPSMLFSADEVQKEKAKSLTGYNAVCDAYIRRENLRVWHIVKKSLDVWMEGGRVVLPLIVTGTAGIGKSFATGSLLLYKLLHYQSKRLKMIAYFVKGQAYIFHREERRVVYYRRQSAAVEVMHNMLNNGIHGYIIFDTTGNSINIEDLPHNCGIVLISSPNVKDLQKFKTPRQDTLSIYMNCYEDAEFKAALVWKRHWQVVNKQIELEDVNLENDWKVLKKRIDMVGPVPRYVFASEATYKKRVEEVANALSRTLDEDLERYVKYLSGQKEWYTDDTINTVMKLVRVRNDCSEEARVEAVRPHVREEKQETRKGSAETELDVSLQVLRNEQKAFDFEKLGLKAFTIESVVTEMVRHLNYLPREGETEESRTSVLAQAGVSGRFPTSIIEFSKNDKKKMEIVAECLYKPTFHNFPVVDGFFLVDAAGDGVVLPDGAEAPTQTIVLLQVTKRPNHHTETRKVKAFRKRMATYFTNWTEMQSRLSYEIIYVQHADIKPITERQRCDCSGEVGDEANERFWSSIHQFQTTP